MYVCTYVQPPSYYYIYLLFFTILELRVSCVVPYAWRRRSQSISCLFALFKERIKHCVNTAKQCAHFLAFLSLESMIFYLC